MLNHYELNEKLKRIFSKNLNYYLDKYGYSRIEFINKVNEKYPFADFKYTTITDWIKGNAIPRVDKIEIIANFFGINKSNLIEENSNTEKVMYDKKDLVKMPVIGSIPAGTPLEAIQYIDDSDCLYIPKSRLRGGQENYFLLRIQGNSMNPKYLAGDVILFFINPSPDSGSEVAAMVNGDDATFKQIFISENGVTLHPYNSLFDDMHYSIKEIRELPVRVLGVAQSLEYRDLRG